MKPSQSLFKHEYIEIGDKKHPTKNYLFYEGYLVDEPTSSYASGSIIDGAFYGSINTKNGKYHIESSKRYNGTFGSHSIIYHEDDAINTNLKKRDLSEHADHLGCVSEHIIDSIKKVQREAYDENIKNV